MATSQPPSIQTDIPSSGSSTHSVLDSKFPVFLPFTDALTSSTGNFDAYVQERVRSTTRRTGPAEIHGAGDTSKHQIPSGTGTDKRLKYELPERKRSSPKDHTDESVEMQIALQRAEKGADTQATTPSGARKRGSNEMLTQNADLAFKSSKDPLVDLFYENGEDISADKLGELLRNAWAEDPCATLKIIFNGRSIHIGKGNRIAAYRCFGWLAENHPLTLITNLHWLTRPLIEKKVKTAEGDDDEMVIIESSDVKDGAETDVVDGTSAHDVRFGGSHGYWKDLLNIAALAANDELNVNGHIRSILNVKAKKKKPQRVGKIIPGSEREKDEPDTELSIEGKNGRQALRDDRHSRLVIKFETDPIYRALHLTVARLFAQQLKLDKQLLDSGKKTDLKRVSLAAKWTPTFAQFHDKHTFILSSIAEILFPHSEICPEVPKENRDLYLRHAREALRKQIVSPLRKFLGIVERDITAERFGAIKYDRVPSLAMAQYRNLFVKKDLEHFAEYIDSVSSGKKRISGAILLPSTLVRNVRPADSGTRRGKDEMKKKIEAAIRDMRQKVSEAQWKTLVERIRDSGKLESSIAVCDVSGSMLHPKFTDRTCPMDSAVGLSLLLAEITEPPFGGQFISFSQKPTLHVVGGPSDARTLTEKVQYIMSSKWGMNTNFVAVFEDIILPLAKEKKLKREEMVKQVFVFSDMQFDAATGHASSRWSTSYQRIQEKFKKAGYEMPKLIFWNLGGVGNGLFCRSKDSTTPKPVTADVPGTTLVSGYSQGQMKMFLDNGQFEDLEVEEKVEIDDAAEDSDEGMITVRKTKEEKMDPSAMVRKAISHKAYEMLKVVD